MTYEKLTRIAALSAAEDAWIDRNADECPCPCEKPMGDVICDHDHDCDCDPCDCDCHDEVRTAWRAVIVTDKVVSE